MFWVWYYLQHHVVNRQEPVNIGPQVEYGNGPTIVVIIFGVIMIGLLIFTMIATWSNSFIYRLPPLPPPEPKEKTKE